MNSRALKRAWVIRWKNVRVGIPRPRVDNITPSWLRVDRAIIFFKSDSSIADKPAINIVRDAINRREGRNRWIEERRG